MRYGRSYAVTSRISGGGKIYVGDIPVGVAVETDTSHAVGIEVSGVGVQRVILTTDPVQQRAKRLIGAVNNPFIMSPGPNTGGAYVNYATETDTAHAITGGVGVVPVGEATETDTGHATTPAEKTIQLGQAITADTGHPVLVVFGTLLGVSIEVDSGLALANTKTIELGLATELDTAYSAEVALTELGFATEVDVGLPLTIIYQRPVFVPPMRLEVPPILPDSRGPSRRLFRHYRTRPAGVNVYIYSNGLVSEDDPDGDQTYWLPEQGSPYVLHVFWGGHEPEEVTEEERSLLEGAGYEVVFLADV